jgi:hypothetical protein
MTTDILGWAESEASEDILSFLCGLRTSSEGVAMLPYHFTDPSDEHLSSGTQLISAENYE